MMKKMLLSLAMVISNVHSFAEEVSFTARDLGIETKKGGVTYQPFHTKESLVTIDGVTYHQVEYLNQRFYVRFREGEFPSDTSLQKDCVGLPKQYKSVLAHGEVRLVPRTAVFINALKTHCGEVPQVKDVDVGVQWRKNAVSVNPFLNSINFSGEF